MSHNEPTNEQVYATYPTADSSDYSTPGYTSASAPGSVVATSPTSMAGPAAVGAPRTRSVALAIVSLVLGVPLTGIGGDSGFLGTLVAWLGIVAVNVVYYLGVHRR